MLSFKGIMKARPVSIGNADPINNKSEEIERILSCNLSDNVFIAPDQGTPAAEALMGDKKFVILPFPILI